MYRAALRRESVNQGNNFSPSNRAGGIIFLISLETSGWESMEELCQSRRRGALIIIA